MATFEIKYEIKTTSKQVIKTVLVTAQSPSDAKRFIEKSETNYLNIWHMDCKYLQIGEVYLVKEETRL